MRSLISFPILVLVAAFASARAQPGPEVPPEPVLAPSTEPVVVVPPPPLPSLVTEPGAAVPQNPEDDPLVRQDRPSPSVDSLAAQDPSPTASLDSARAEATRAALRAADSAAAAGRMRADEARHRARSGFGQPPPAQVFVPEPVVTTVSDPDPDTATWVDERGDGRRLKNDPRAHKLYRSPRKAFFYSLVVPGSGQAWCGAYVRAGLFAAAEVGLLYGWYDVSIRQAREKSKEAKRFADENWSASRYESTRKRYYDSAALQNRDQANLARTTPYRDRYCEAIYAFDETALRDACNNTPDDSAKNYQGHLAILDDEGLTTDQVSELRDARIKDPAAFYDRIGRDEEFVPGWKDATTGSVTLNDLLAYETAMTDNDPSTVPDASPWGVSQMRAEYLALRQDADDLAATQGWFLGGLVLNHMVSAIDAALTAQRHNRRLYNEERTSWVDGLHVQGGLAWTNGPATRADFQLEF